MIEGFTRRGVLAGAMALPVAPALAQRRRPIRAILLGQSLIHEDLCAGPWPGLDGIRAALAGADVVFTDLETAIEGPGAGPATRTGETLHTAPAYVIDCLKSLGVSIVTTANNHAWDLGSTGILTAIDALDRRGIIHAGTGRDIDTAFAPAVQQTPAGAFALVSAATGAIRDGAGATPNRAGVAELRRLASGELDAGDVARSLDAIRRARADGATVLFCLHNHHWEPVQSDTPAFQRAFARQCIDAGAAAFVAHGTPLMQGIERYKGAPLFHGLGNFIFQTRKVDGFYKEPTWRSLIVDARFRDGCFLSATLIPVGLDASKHGGEFSRGTPGLLAGATRRRL
ncbi:CapA family protein [Sphingomonas sp.]|uniref:CapA family protein n=1 Tax=Sphingomonas sp. TaxID=28214 RepID=UPI002DD6B89C|nr:CapA family protein [Sphingomonas sp.]